MISIPLFLDKLTTLFSTPQTSWQDTIQTIAGDQQLAIFYAVLLLTLVWYAWFLVIHRKKHQFPLPPGPRGIPVLGSLPFLDPELHSHFANLARTYGPILTLRLGRKTHVVISSPAMAREVLKENDVTFANRDTPHVVTAMEYGGHDIVFSQYGAEWRMVRKVCVRDMIGGGSTLDTFYSYRRQEVRSTIKYFYGLNGSPVNVGEQMFVSVLNLITNMLWGGTIKGEERATIAAEFRQVVTEITELLGKPNLSDFFPGLARFDLQGLKKHMSVAIKKLEAIFEEIIRQRTNANNLRSIDGGIDLGPEVKDFLQVLLRLKDEGDPKTPLTMTHVKALLVDMVVGGTETTSNTVEFALAEMMNKPDVMIRAQQELDNVVGKNNAVEESHLGKLTFLHAIMKEVLRLHPALPLMVPHYSSEQCIVANYTIPKGTQVFVNVWAIHRDPTLWENPTEFNPDRFLNGKGDYSGNDFSYIPFGSGRRICAGMAMGERIVMYSLASLIHSFDWKLPEKQTLDLSERFGIVLKKRIPLVAIPIPRLSDAAAYE